MAIVENIPMTACAEFQRCLIEAQTTDSFLPYAKDGSAKAKAILALSYHNGRGAKRDMDLYKEAATHPSFPKATSVPFTC
ncbi:hypothetical protein AAMO2058_000439300 [Amorphochlora amoebiformis]